MEAKANIFLVEDDHNFGSVLKAYLEMNGFQVSWVDDGKDAIPEFKQKRYDLCVFDVMLPNMNGFTIAESIKKINPAIPFIFLTAKTLKADILKGYATGADDYITKPFDSEVLICKIEAILSRTQGQAGIASQSETYAIGIYFFDPTLREIRLEKTARKLSPKESELLHLLCQYRNKVLPREHALRTIWGEESYFTTRSMDVFIAKLRKYLKADPTVEIMTVHGNGFRLIIDE